MPGVGIVTRCGDDVAGGGDVCGDHDKFATSSATAALASLSRRDRASCCRRNVTSMSCAALVSLSMHRAVMSWSFPVLARWRASCWCVLRHSAVLAASCVCVRASSSSAWVALMWARLRTASALTAHARCRLCRLLSSPYRSCIFRNSAAVSASRALTRACTSGVIVGWTSKAACCGAGLGGGPVVAVGGPLSVALSAWRQEAMMSGSSGVRPVWLLGDAKST